MVLRHSLDYTRIIFNMMKVWNLFYSSLESIELANQILPHVIQLSNDIVTRQLVIRTNRHFSQLNQLVGVIEIAEDCCNDLVIDLEICNYSNLERIVVKKNSLKNLNSLVISNNLQLKSIETKDGGYETGAFYNVKIVEISSIF